MKTITPIVCLPVLLFATTTFAAQGLVEVKPFTGPAARKVQAAVREELCSSIVCGKNSKGNSKLSGRVIRQVDGWAVDLRLWDRDGRPLLRRLVDLSKTFTPRETQLASARSGIVQKLTAVQPGSDSPSGRERRLGRVPPPVSRVSADDEEEEISSRKGAKLSKRKASDEDLEDDSPRRSRRGGSEMEEVEESTSSRKVARSSKSRSSDEDSVEESESPRRKSSRLSSRSSDEDSSDESDSPRRKSSRLSSRSSDEDSSDESDSSRRKSSRLASRSSDEETESPRRKSSRASASDEDESPRRRRGSDEIAERRSFASSDSSGEVGGVEGRVSRDDRPSPRVDPLFTVEASTWFFSRSFQYSGQQNSALISMPGGLSVAPRISAEIYPFARKMGGGIGAQFSFARTLGNRIQLSDGRSFGATVQNWDAALTWKFLPWGTGRAWITPHAGLSGMQFAVGQDDQGNVLNGLPGTNYFAASLGAGAGVPVGDRVSLFLDLAYKGVITAGQITSVNYFNGGRTNGFAARAGVGVRITSMLEITAAGGYDIYMATFAQPADGVVNATGSSDAYVSGNLGLKLLL